MKRKYLCHRDYFDGDDFLFDRTVRLPDHVDPRQSTDHILDQGQLGSCVLNARAAMVEDKIPGFWDSRLAGYYWARSLERSTRQDAGCYPRDALKVLTKHGTADETDWPYDISNFRKRPPAKCYADARTNKGWRYERVVGLDAILAAFAAGHDILFGLTLFPQFEDGGAFVTMPTGKPVGGHGMRGRGYTSLTGSRLAILQNSWGPEDGDHGYRYFPLDYIGNPKLCSDAWILTKVT